MDYSIDGFWKSHFTGVVTQSQATPVQGWTFQVEGDESYVQAALSLRKGYDDLSPSVWLIGAPGAVGKSTLGKEICAATGAVYLDLASAATVAGNYMVGGLVHANLWTAWTSGKTAVVVDALDEARLRVTQSGFDDFLIDLAKAAALGKFPVVVLGRVGIIEEAWATLSEHAQLEAPIFDIELFDETQANQFVFARLRKLAKETDSHGRLVYPELQSALRTHTTVYAGVIQSVVAGLKQIAREDGNRFVGYAPVLDAVAKVIADERNPAKIGENMQEILRGEVLTSLSNEILIRERGKLTKQLESSLGQLPPDLYEPSEQLERLGARLFQAKPPPLPPQLSAQQIAGYEEAVNALLPQHPFLDGKATGPSSAVFAACITASALNGPREELRRAAEIFATSGKHTPNPFLYDFYQERAESSDRIPTEHVGIIFESVLARAKPGEAVRLSVESEEDAQSLSVEVTVDRPDEEPVRLELTAPSGGTIRLGRRVSGVSIDAEETVVELGTRDQLELVAPVFIAARALALLCDQIVVKTEPHSAEDAVILEAAELIAEPGLLAPTVRPGAQLQVSWPDALSYPWTAFAAPAGVEENPRTAEALRALRRLVIAFRSHSKGQLARYKGKIEHQRMMKGDIGRQLLRKLMDDKVITLDSPRSMYVLDPDALGAKVGASFVNVKLKQYSDRTREYLQDIFNAQ